MAPIQGLIVAAMEFIGSQYSRCPAELHNEACIATGSSRELCMSMPGQIPPTFEAILLR
jgi:hypothetical protein